MWPAFKSLKYDASLKSLNKYAESKYFIFTGSPFNSVTSSTSFWFVALTLIYPSVPSLLVSHFKNDECSSGAT